jgi:RNA recognition motif-containing protein
MYAYDPILNQYPAEKAKLYDVIKKFTNRLRYIHPYWLTTDISDVTVPDQSTATYYAKCGDDGCVEIFGITAVSSKNEFQVEISEVETRTTLHNGAITQTNGVGTGSLPFKFPTSYVLPPGARIKLKFTDIGTAGSDLTAYFCLFGRKIYAPIKNAKEAVRDLVVPVLADERPQMVPPVLVGV